MKKNRNTTAHFYPLFIRYSSWHQSIIVTLKYMMPCTQISVYVCLPAADKCVCMYLTDTPSQCGAIEYVWIQHLIKSMMSKLL